MLYTIQQDWTLDALTLDDLWDAGLTGTGIPLGTLDSGIQGDHPAFAGRDIRFRAFDRRGFPVDGARPVDVHGHGTSTTSLIARTAPGAALFLGAVIEDGDVIARILFGLSWLLECRARIVCLPLGIPPNPIFLGALRALHRQDALIVAPAGNRGAGRALSPGNYPEILSIGACDDRGAVPQFSGSAHALGHVECTKPDLLAPGVNLTAAVRSGGFCGVSGTSMACAQVAGVAALLREAVPDAPAAAVERALVESAHSLDEQNRRRARRGMLRPAHALAYLRSARSAGRNRIPSFHDPLAPPNRFLDSRLRDACRYASEKSVIDAAVTVSEDVCAWVAALDPPPLAARPIPPAATAVLSATAPALRCIIEHPAVRVASAVDVSRCTPWQVLRA